MVTEGLTGSLLWSMAAVLYMRLAFDWPDVAPNDVIVSDESFGLIQSFSGSINSGSGSKTGSKNGSGSSITGT